MKPEELREFLPLYALNALSPEERARVEAALSEHPELLPELKALMEAAGLLAEGTEAPLPPGLKARVLSRLRAERRRKVWLPLLARVAAVVLLSALGYGLYFAGGWLLALADPATQVLTLESPQGSAVGRAVLRRDGTVLLLLKASPPSGKVFQAWGVEEGGLRPLPTFRWTPKTLRLPPEAQAVAVSLEPPGGSPAPTEVFALPRTP
ncbi:hypothetical protein Theos_2373 (plasmid) [Thermus oshimai JL-2]|uniref:Regulator of SigK n=1 Tax=Thermus oshimai JL-2 TaxID=751945 RepID=K7R8H0_THEOS|nr:anti-sigma factor [Thermus oshimai]AFV77359.1 hypothetical protein Theos_2373 [Thermus oshimai JL-2]